MAQKAHLLFKLISIVTLASCQNLKEKELGFFSFKSNIKLIPKDTNDSKKIVLNNGVYYLEKKPFSGFVKERFGQKIMSIGSYFNGKQEGETKTFYKNGRLKDSRMYKNGMANGRHFGNWENGKPKFKFFYKNDKKEGLQKQWYESGAKYAFLTFNNDQEEGKQQAWRENGKPYINYEVKDGYRYGLQKSALCYTLRKGKIEVK